MANNPLGSIPLIGTMFGGNAPTMTQAPLDPASQGILNQQAGVAQAGPGAVAAADNQGLNQAAGSMRQTDTGAMHETAGLGNDAGMVQGLRNAYNSQANKSIEMLKSQNQYKAQMQYADYANQVAKEALGQQQAANSMYDMMTKSYESQMQARAGMVSSLFGAAGTAYGMSKGAGKGGGAMQTGTPTTTVGDPSANVSNIA